MRLTRRPLTLRRAETIVLGVLALLLTTATVYDTARGVGIDRRLHADLHSWHSLTGSHDPGAFFLGLDMPGTTNSVVCGRVSPARPGVRYFACLVFQGRVRHDRRSATGGYYFPAYLTPRRWRFLDLPAYRYGCFGPGVRAVKVRCASPVPRGAPDRPIGGARAG